MSTTRSKASASHGLIFPPWLTGRWGRMGIALILYTLVFLVWIQFHWGGEENISLIGDLAILPSALLASLMALRVSVQRQLDRRLRRAWFLLALGSFSNFLGEAGWAYLGNVLHIEPFPSLADIFYLGFYPLVLWGLLSFPGAPLTRCERLEFWLNLGILLITASMFVSYFLIIPTEAVNDNDPLVQLLATAYPICSLILLGGVLALLLRKPESDSRAVLLLLLMGTSFFLVSDLVFGYTSLAGLYAAGSWIEAGWHTAQVFIVLAALRQLYPSSMGTELGPRLATLERFVRFMPLIAILLGYGLVFYIVYVNFYDGAIGMLAGALLLTGLVIGKQIVSPAFANLPIRAKVILTFFLVSSLSVSLVTLMSYFTIRSNLENAVGANLKDHAQDRAVAVGALLAKQSEALEGFVLSNSIQEGAATGSSEYGTNDLAMIWDLFDQRDRAWIDAPDSDPFVRAVLNNEATDELRKFQAHFTNYIDLLLTDKYGAVIAATSRPTTYDQSPLTWWQEAFHKGEGVIYMSQPISEPGTESRYMIIVLPVRAPFSSDLVGLLMATYSLKDMEQMLAAEDIGQISEYGLLLPTGQMLTSSDQFVVLEQSTLERLQEAITSDYALISFNGQPHLVSQAIVTASDADEVLAVDGLNWTLIAYEDRQETFAPLNDAWRTTLLSTLTVLLLTTGLAVVLAQVLVAPISRLTALARKIEAGDLSTKAQVESGDEIGTLAGAFNAMLDALSLARQKLQESEALYRSLVDASPDTITVHRNGRYLFLNPAGVKLLGANSADELVGQEIVEIIPRQDRELVRQGIEQIKGLKESTPLIQQKMHRIDGTSFDAEFRAIPISYAGQPAIQFVMRDITDRKRAEEQIHQLLGEVERQKGDLEIRVAQRTAELNTLNRRLLEELSERQRLVQSLRESEEQFRLLFAASPDAIVLIDPHDPNISWPIVDCNEVACTMNGYTREDLIGQSIDLLHSAPGDLVERRAYLEFLRQEGVLHREGFHRHKDGHVFPIEMSSSLITFAGRELVLGIDRDITERKQTEVALQQAKEIAESASRAKSEFLSRMSHELRTPMNAILGFAQLLNMSRKEPLTPTQKERVKQITKGGQHLLDLINEILDISRIEAGRLQISPEPVPVRESIQEVLDLTAPLAAERHIQLQTSLEEGFNPYVLADRQRLKQVLLNLLSNAVKYNYDGGFVIVSCQERGVGSWRISVTDTGAGIPAEYIGRLFLPFERLVGEQSNVEGTGLGLALAKRLVEMMDGRIGIESVVGQGSTFWVELPCAESQLERLQRTGGTGQLPAMSTTSRRILYVEDNIANFELIQQVLVDDDQIELLWAASAQTGLESARLHHPDLILLDLHLGGKDGAEVLKQLKEDAETAPTPVIMVSADATPGQIERLLTLGAYSYLTKPLDIKRFIQVVEQILTEKEPLC